MESNQQNQKKLVGESINPQSDHQANNLIQIGQTQINLQDNFKNFLSRKRKLASLTKTSLKTSSQARKNLNSLEFKSELRQKFIDTCKSYIGVPYAQKYHSPESELYKSPIFLDCCALVRQAMRDLSHLFGFCIGSGNQAYQYDTLPIEITEEQAKPGDLIFYRGKNRPGVNMKVQKHDMVHVEVYLGESKSIGSRFNNRTIQIFDSYLFTSTNWELIGVSFKSLETWLDGSCVSHCKEHSWIVTSRCLTLAKGSIFAQEQQDENADQQEP